MMTTTNNTTSTAANTTNSPRTKRTHSRSFDNIADVVDFLAEVMRPLGYTEAPKREGEEDTPWYLGDSSYLADGQYLIVFLGTDGVRVIWRGDALTPAIGDVVTVTVYTDRYTADVVAVSKSGRKITLRRRNAIMVTKPEFVPGGFAAHCTKNATWRTESDPDGTHVDATLRNTGEWKISGHPTRSPGMTVCAGDYHHYDYNF